MCICVCVHMHTHVHRHACMWYMHMHMFVCSRSEFRSWYQVSCSVTLYFTLSRQDSSLEAHQFCWASLPAGPVVLLPLHRTHPVLKSQMCTRVTFLLGYWRSDSQVLMFVQQALCLARSPTHPPPACRLSSCIGSRDKYTFMFRVF